MFQNAAEEFNAALAKAPPEIKESAERYISTFKNPETTPVNKVKTTLSNSMDILLLHVYPKRVGVLSPLLAGLTKKKIMRYGATVRSHSDISKDILAWATLTGNIAEGDFK
jgi:hypothetical protein